MRAWSFTGGLLVAALAATSCFDRGSRWFELPEPTPPATTRICVPASVRCDVGRLERCDDGPSGPSWTMLDDCAKGGLVCAARLARCAECLPDAGTCKGQDAYACDAQGNTSTRLRTCDPTSGAPCRDGLCVDLCAQAAKQRSNVGCEYWAVDLDNAMISASSNAAAQQFAVVVSNPQPDVTVKVHIFQDDGAPGEAPQPVEIQSATIAPRNLQVFKLGPREIDGSADGQYDNGTNTALTRHAYKITSDFPVVAYQFNPLENANVFSNDASLLKPVEALAPATAGLSLSYVVASWPQTIAATDDPSTNFDPQTPTNLRAFLTIVGTRPDTHVEVRTTTAVVPGGPVPATPARGTITATLDAFDVLNLETGEFNADFTGSVIKADGPIAVFTGSEASDAPHFTTLAERRCCADHLEDQLDPVRTAGKRFVIAHTPSRTRAVAAAGATTGVVPEPDFVRFVAATDKGAVIKTTLPRPDDVIHLVGIGGYHEVKALRDFTATSTEPVSVVQIMASQDAAFVKRGLPGGDPSLLVEPPIEQFRADYVFLTPDKYAFDFVSVVAPAGATVLLDGTSITALSCDVGPADGLTTEARGGAAPAFIAYRCQLSFPTIDPQKAAPNNVSPGAQNDGVHRVLSNQPVGVVVSGFDSYVSYAYAAGTELRDLSVTAE
jgi:IgGFc binding protein